MYLKVKAAPKKEAIYKIKKKMAEAPNKSRPQDEVSALREEVEELKKLIEDVIELL